MVEKSQDGGEKSGVSSFAVVVWRSCAAVPQRPPSFKAVDRL